MQAQSQQTNAYGGDTIVAPMPRGGMSDGPQKLPASLAVLAVGCGVLACTLLAVVLGVPAHLFAQASVPSAPVAATAGQANMMGSTKNIAQNIAYIHRSTGYAKGDYNAYLHSIDANESHILSLEKRLGALNVTVGDIDHSVSARIATVRKMRTDMAAMLTQSQHAGSQMSSITGAAGKLAVQLEAMSIATTTLANSVQKIDGVTTDIAKNKISKAATLTHSLNGSLPNGVPAPTTSLSPLD